MLSSNTYQCKVKKFKHVVQYFFYNTCTRIKSHTFLLFSPNACLPRVKKNCFVNTNMTGYEWLRKLSFSSYWQFFLHTYYIISKDPTRQYTKTSLTTCLNDCFIYNFIIYRNILFLRIQYQIKSFVSQHFIKSCI